MLQPNPYNPNKDAVVQALPDGISSISWSKKANYFVAGSWDNKVRCWEVGTTAQGIAAIPKAAISHDAPVLCTVWSGDGQRVFSAGCDNKAKMWPLAGGNPIQIAQHNAPIKSICYLDEFNIVVTGSWDKTVKYWDTRSPNPAYDVTLPERVYAMDCSSPVCVVATADKMAIVYDIRKPTIEYKRFPNLLKYQSRCISLFPDKTGFALGSIEGRVAIHHIEDKDRSRDFAFKCHRDAQEIYAVNNIAFHPCGTFATTGSDGTFNFWDKDNRQRLKAFNRCNQPIPCGAFNYAESPSIFAYAVSYDWSKGAEFYNPQTTKNYILLHLTSETEIKNRRGKH